MKIAFTSCMSTRVFDDQPVWEWIQAQQPDYLVLLGDSVYLDIHFKDVHPMDMTDLQFADHLHANYAELLAHKQFRALVQSMAPKTVFSIWDDHDFLWNNMAGAEAMASPIHRGKVAITSAFQVAFRQALAAGIKAGSFPASATKPSLWTFQAMPLPTPSVTLPHNTVLHLSDGRTHRTRKWAIKESAKTILGLPQKKQFASVYNASHPDSVHLFASGSTLIDYKKSFPQDWLWLSNLATQRRTLVLSGDLHRNESSHHPTQPFMLHEATASGAAVRDAVVIGEKRENHGLLDIDDACVTVSLFEKNALETAKSFQLDRQHWLVSSVDG